MLEYGDGDVVVSSDAERVDRAFVLEGYKWGSGGFGKRRLFMSIPRFFHKILVLPWPWRLPDAAIFAAISDRRHRWLGGDRVGRRKRFQPATDETAAGEWQRRGR